jgi:tRNA(Ile)-lysidine synthase
MPERSDFAGHALLRPLLGETRASLEAWAREHQLSWIEDESNQDDSYDRNFLRLRVLPLLTSAGRILPTRRPEAPCCAPNRKAAG